MIPSNLLNRRRILNGVHIGRIWLVLLGSGLVFWMTTWRDRPASPVYQEHSISAAATLTLSNLLSLPDSELARVDIGVMNLLCAEGLSSTAPLSMDSAVQELNRMAERVENETIRHRRRFELEPREFGHSEAYYRLLCLVTVLQQDFGVKYSPARARPSQGVIEPNETFFADARDIFVTGLSAGRYAALSKAKQKPRYWRTWVSYSRRRFPLTKTGFQISCCKSIKRNGTPKAHWIKY